MSVNDWSTTPNDNTDINGIDISEGCSPGGLNDAIRNVMADAKVRFNSLDVGSDVQAYDAALQSLSGLTSSADKFPYFTGVDTFALGDVTAFGRSLLADTQSSDGRTTLELQYATQEQAEAGTEIRRVMSPLRTAQAIEAQFTELFGTEGYTQLPNGFLLQWGRTPSVQPENVVTFPIAFPTAVLGGLATVRRPNVVQGAMAAYFEEISLTQANVTRDATPTDFQSPVQWLAFGY